MRRKRLTQIGEMDAEPKGNLDPVAGDSLGLEDGMRTLTHMG